MEGLLLDCTEHWIIINDDIGWQTTMRNKIVSFHKIPFSYNENHFYCLRFEAEAIASIQINSFFYRMSLQTFMVISSSNIKVIVKTTASIDLSVQIRTLDSRGCVYSMNGVCYK